MSVGPKKQRGERGIERGSIVFSGLFAYFFDRKKVRPVRLGQEQKNEIAEC
jgi:hypothetical protein